MWLWLLIPVAAAVLLFLDGLLVALAATFLFLTAVRHLGPDSAGLTLALAPALAILLGAVVLGKPMTIISLTGAVLILGGFVTALCTTNRDEPEQ